MESDPVKGNVGAGSEVTTAVLVELEGSKEKATQTPPRTQISRHAMNDDRPDAQEQEQSEMIASPVKSDTVILAIPQNQDTLKILCSKLTAIADVVTAGRSVAVATGYSAAANQEQRAVQKAINQMSSLEGEVWAWFEKGSCTLPDMDWRINIDSTPLSHKPLKTAHRRAEALNRLYKTDQAQPCHSVWFTKNCPEYHPLVKAMARVIGAERDLVGGGVWTATQLADLQSINKILPITGQIVSGCASDPLVPAIIRAQAVLASHRDTLRNLIVGRKRKREA